MFKQIFLIVILSITGFSQTPSPTPHDRSKPVQVDQGFVDDATAAFAELPALRDSVQKFLVERARSEVERSTGESLIKGLNDFLALKDRMISQYELMTQALSKMIEFLDKINSTLMAKLNKPKGFFQKLLEGAKKILEAAFFILIGRGIGSFWTQYDKWPDDRAFGMARKTAVEIMRTENSILRLSANEKSRPGLSGLFPIII